MEPPTFLKEGFDGRCDTYPQTQPTCNSSMIIADHLDPELLYMVVPFGAAFVALSLLFAVGVWKHGKKPFLLKMYMLCGTACFSLVVGTIDPWGARGWLPHAVYYIADEVAAGCFTNLLIVLVDHIMRLQVSMGGGGLPRVVFVGAITANLLNYIVLTVVGLIFSENYILYSAIKGLVGGGLILGVLAQSYITTKSMLGVLSSGDNLTSPGTSVKVGKKTRILRRRMRRIWFLGTVVSLVLIGMSVMELVEHVFALSVSPGTLIWFAIIRVIFLAASVLVAINFPVLKSLHRASAKQLSRLGSSTRRMSSRALFGGRKFSRSDDPSSASTTASRDLSREDTIAEEDFDSETSELTIAHQHERRDSLISTMETELPRPHTRV